MAEHAPLSALLQVVNDLHDEMTCQQPKEEVEGFFLTKEAYAELKVRISGSIAAHITAVTGMIRHEERKKLAEAIKRFRKGAEEANLLKGLYMRTYQEMMSTGRVIHLPAVKRNPKRHR